MNSMTEKEVRKEAQLLEKTYDQQFRLIESVRQSLYNKYKLPLYGKPLNDFEKYSIGVYLDNWKKLKPLEVQRLQESGVTSADVLGPIAKTDLDLVATQIAVLPITALASVQPLQSRIGLVYYRRAVATTTRGGVTQGTELISPTGVLNTSVNLDRYVSDTLVDNSYTYNGTDTSKTWTLSAPVRPNSVRVNGPQNTFAIDDGSGNIVGRGMDGTINYDTGQLTVYFRDRTGWNNGDVVSVTYSVNLVAADTISGFKWIFESKEARAKFYVLQTDYSTLDDLEVRQRFGQALDVQAQADLVNQINGAVLMEAIRTLYQSALQVSTTIPTFNITPPTGISLREHLAGFDYYLEEARIEISKRTYTAVPRALITSDVGLKVLRTIGATVVDRSVAGPYYAGEYRGMAIYYVPPSASLMPSNDMVVVHRGDNWFESPLVYAPYLPVTVSEIPGTNAFRALVGAAHAAAVESVVPAYAQLIRFTTV